MRYSVHYWFASVRINPASPAFAGWMRPLHEVCAALGSWDQLSALAMFGTLGALVTLAQRVFR